MSDKPTIEMRPDDEQAEYDPPDPDDVAARLREIREEHYDESDIEAAQAHLDSIGGDTGNGRSEKADVDYETFDDALLDAIKKSSWWATDEYDDGVALSKAPGIWRHDDRVPQYVQDVIADVIDNTRWDWDQFDSLSVTEADRLADLLKERLTQPQGWSIESIARDVQDEFDLPEDVAVGVSADSTHNVLNTAREEGYERMEGSEQFEYSWINPQGHRTTDVCNEIIAAVEDKGGSVTMPTLKAILRRKAQKYAGTREGGTPDRVDKWEPHYQCRSTFVREVQAI